MANQAKRPTPDVQLGTRLALLKRNGVPFDAAWESAWSHIVWPHPTVDRRAWKRALASTRSHWEDAYDGIFTPVRDLGSSRTSRELVA